jgi:hypothetical protein
VNRRHVVVAVILLSALAVAAAALALWKSQKAEAPAASTRVAKNSARNPEYEASCARAASYLREGLLVPVADRAEQAIASNELNYFAVATFPRPIVVGIKDGACAEQAKLVEPFRSVSDEICSDEYLEARTQVFVYAEAYNRRISAARKALGMQSCDGANPSTERTSSGNADLWQGRR